VFLTELLLQNQIFLFMKRAFYHESLISIVAKFQNQIFLNLIIFRWKLILKTYFFQAYWNLDLYFNSKINLFLLSLKHHFYFFYYQIIFSIIYNHFQTLNDLSIYHWTYHEPTYSIYSMFTNHRYPQHFNYLKWVTQPT